MHHLRAPLTITALLAMIAGIAHALPPENAPGPKHCHWKQVCVTKTRVCPHPGPGVHKPGTPGTQPCTPGPYQSCTRQWVCGDL